MDLKGGGSRSSRESIGHDCHHHVIAYNIYTTEKAIKPSPLPCTQPMTPIWWAHESCSYSFLLTTADGEKREEGSQKVADKRRVCNRTTKFENKKISFWPQQERERGPEKEYFSLPAAWTLCPESIDKNFARFSLGPTCPAPPLFIHWLVNRTNLIMQRA